MLNLKNNNINNIFIGKRKQTNTINYLFHFKI